MRRCAAGVPLILTQSQILSELCTLLVEHVYGQLAAVCLPPILLLSDSFQLSNIS